MPDLLSPKDVESLVAVDVMPPSVLGDLERAEIDIQIATAHRFPRSMTRFIQKATDMVTQDKEIAEACFYSRNVGKDPETGQAKIAEGVSIRLAEMVCAAYGNIRAAARIVDMSNPAFVRCEGVCLDLENNVASKAEAIESTLTKYGKPYSERMRVVVAKAAMAKAYRDAVFRVIPKAMVKPVVNAAREVIDGGKTIEQRRDSVRAWVEKTKVDPARVFSTIGVKGWSDIGQEHLDVLRGFATAIKEGDMTVDEAFPMPEAVPPKFETVKPPEEPKKSLPISRPANRPARSVPDRVEPQPEPPPQSEPEIPWDQVTPAGEPEPAPTPSEPVKTAPKERESGLNYNKAVRGLMRLGNVREDELIAVMRKVLKTDETLRTLDEIAEISPESLRQVHDGWQMCCDQVKELRKAAKNAK